MKFSIMAGLMRKYLKEITLYARNAELSNIALEIKGSRLWITSGEEELRMRKELLYGSASEEDNEGIVCVKKSRLDDILKAIQASVIDIESKYDDLLILESDTTYKLTGQGQEVIDKYFQWPTYKVQAEILETSIELPIATFLWIVDKVGFCTTKSDYRPELNKTVWEVENEMLKIHATDSKRLAQIKIAGVVYSKDLRKVRISPIALQAAAKYLTGNGKDITTVRIGWCKEFAILFVGNTQILCPVDIPFENKGFNEYYNDVERVIPASSPREAILNKAELIKAVEKVLAVPTNNKAAFVFDLNLLRIHCDSDGGGIDISINLKAPCVYEGYPLLTLFNPAYLASILPHIHTDLIRWQFGGQLRTSMLLPFERGEDKYLYLLTPLKVYGVDRYLDGYDEPSSEELERNVGE